MGDGHRTAALNLLLKQWNNTAVAAQHVAEPYRHTGHGGAAGEGLNQHFAQALCAAHNVGRVDGLIGGELHKALYLVLGGGGQQILCAKDVVLDCLTRTAFHERHMLVRSRMVHNLWLVCLEYLIDSPAVTHRTNQNG